MTFSFLFSRRESLVYRRSHVIEEKEDNDTLSGPFDGGMGKPAATTCPGADCERRLSRDGD